MSGRQQSLKRRLDPESDESGTKRLCTITNPRGYDRYVDRLARVLLASSFSLDNISNLENIYDIIYDYWAPNRFEYVLAFQPWSEKDMANASLLDVVPTWSEAKQSLSRIMCSTISICQETDDSSTLEMFKRSGLDHYRTPISKLLDIQLDNDGLTVWGNEVDQDLIELAESRIRVGNSLTYPAVSYYFDFLSERHYETLMNKIFHQPNGFFWIVRSLTSEREINLRCILAQILENVIPADLLSYSR